MMKNVAITCFLLLLIFSIAAISLAAAKRTKASFKKLDGDNNGKLTLEEFSTGKRNKLKAKNTFEKLDRDDDKLLTVREYTA